MKLLMIIFIAVIIFYLMRSSNSTTVVNISPKQDLTMGIKEGLRKDKFVKPTHNLLYIFNQMSSHDKIRLNGNCKSSIFTRDTIPKNKDEYLKDVMNVVIEHVKHIDSEQDYFLKEVDQVYEQSDIHGNKRYIIISFIFAPFLFTIFSEVPNKEKFMTSSFPSFVSPPNIFRLNSFLAL